MNQEEIKKELENANWKINFHSKELALNTLLKEMFEKKLSELISK